MGLGLWLAGNEGMQNKMETTIAACIETTTIIHPFIKKSEAVVEVSGHVSAIARHLELSGDALKPTDLLQRA